MLVVFISFWVRWGVVRGLRPLFDKGTARVRGCGYFVGFAGQVKLTCFQVRRRVRLLACRDTCGVVVCVVSGGTLFRSFTVGFRDQVRVLLPTFIGMARCLKVFLGVLGRFPIYVLGFLNASLGGLRRSFRGVFYFKDRLDRVFLRLLPVWLRSVGWWVLFIVRRFVGHAFECEWSNDGVVRSRYFSAFLNG